MEFTPLDTELIRLHQTLCELTNLGLVQPKWCRFCKAHTQHRVDNGVITRVCIPCQEKAEAEHAERLAHPQKSAAVQVGLFQVLATLVFLAVAFVSASAQGQTTQPIFSTSSKIEMSLAGVAIAGDAYTSRRFTDLGYQDRNFVARPFVSSNAGTVAYFGASFSGVVLGNRMLRNHPRLRHVLNWSVIGGEAFATAYNAGFLARVDGRKKRS